LGCSIRQKKDVQEDFFELDDIGVRVEALEGLNLAQAPHLLQRFEVRFHTFDGSVLEQKKK